MKDKKKWHRVEEGDTHTTWVYRGAKEYAVVAPNGYVPSIVYATMHGFNPDRVCALATQGYLELSAKQNATVKLGSYRFIHVDARIKPSAAVTPKQRKPKKEKIVVEL